MNTNLPPRRFASVHTWWNRLSSEQRRVYLKSHPNSKLHKSSKKTPKPKPIDKSKVKLPQQKHSISSDRTS